MVGSDGYEDFHREVKRVVEIYWGQVRETGIKEEVPFQIAAAALSMVLARVIGMDLDETYVPRPLPDQVFSGLVGDFELTLLKGLRHEYPDMLSEEQQRRVASLDRLVKRRRQMPNAEPGGEA